MLKGLDESIKFSGLKLFGRIMVSIIWLENCVRCAFSRHFKSIGRQIGEPVMSISTLVLGGGYKIVLIDFYYFFKTENAASEELVYLNGHLLRVLISGASSDHGDAWALNIFSWGTLVSEIWHRWHLQYEMMAVEMMTVKTVVQYTDASVLVHLFLCAKLDVLYAFERSVHQSLTLVSPWVTLEVCLIWAALPTSIIRGTF